MLHKKSKMAFVVCFALMVMVFCWTTYSLTAKLSQTETQSAPPKTETKRTVAKENVPAAGSNTILAIYELDDKIIFLVKNMTSASVLSWTAPGRQTEHFLSYGTLFTSADQGETMPVNTKYQIRLDNEGSPTYSEVYYFQGNRAVLDYLDCPYENYIHDECKLEAQEENASTTPDQKLKRDAQRRSDLKEIRAAVEKYYEDKDAYPTTLSQVSPYVSGDLPRDPLTQEYYRYTVSKDLPQTYLLCIPAKNIESDPGATEDYCLTDSR